MSDSLHQLSLDDLEIINGALNEICNGVHIDDWEFRARMGVDREEAQALCDRVYRAMKTVETRGK